MLAGREERISEVHVGRRVPGGSVKHFPEARGCLVRSTSREEGAAVRRVGAGGGERLAQRRNRIEVVAVPSQGAAQHVGIVGIAGISLGRAPKDLDRLSSGRLLPGGFVVFLVLSPAEPRLEVYGGRPGVEAEGVAEMALLLATKLAL